MYTENRARSASVMRMYIDKKLTPCCSQLELEILFAKIIVITQRTKYKDILY